MSKESSEEIKHVWTKIDYSKKEIGFAFLITLGVGFAGASIGILSVDEGYTSVYDVVGYALMGAAVVNMVILMSKPSIYNVGTISYEKAVPATQDEYVQYVDREKAKFKALKWYEKIYK